MAETLATEAVPLVTGADGVIRVRGTRVTLDTIVAAFMDGANAEEIVQQYPSVSLADAYQVIGYYLRHAEELQGYLTDRERRAEDVQRENEARRPPQGFRERLIRRRQK